jgi:hypothetical protein
MVVVRVETCYFMPFPRVMRARTVLKLCEGRLLSGDEAKWRKTAQITRAYYNTVIHVRN